MSTIQGLYGGELPGKLEGDPMVFEVELELPEGAESLLQAVTVTYETEDGVAMTSDGDYTEKTGQLTFAIGAQGGDLLERITVDTLPDRKVEANEEFKLVLTGATNASVGTASANGVIRNNDVDIQIHDATAEEGTKAKPMLGVQGIATARQNGLNVYIKGSTSDGVGPEGAVEPSDYKKVQNYKRTVYAGWQWAAEITIKKHFTNEALDEFFLYSITLDDDTSADAQVDITFGTARITIPHNNT